MSLSDGRRDLIPIADCQLIESAKERQPNRPHQADKVLTGKDAGELLRRVS